MKKSDLFPSKYIKAEDLSEEVPVIIAGLEMEELQGNDGKKEKKGVLYFKGLDKGLVLNKTNWDRIEAQHGEESDNWPGKRITLFAEPEARSESGWSARVKPAKPMPKGGGLKPTPQAEPTPEDMSASFS